jgi:hypothetical protein
LRIRRPPYSREDGDPAGLPSGIQRLNKRIAPEPDDPHQDRVAWRYVYDPENRLAVVTDTISGQGV